MKRIKVKRGHFLCCLFCSKEIFFYLFLFIFYFFYANIQEIFWRYNDVEYN